jgi:hypothetical protein
MVFDSIPYSHWFLGWFLTVIFFVLLQFRFVYLGMRVSGKFGVITVGDLLRETFANVFGESTLVVILLMILGILLWPEVWFCVFAYLIFRAAKWLWYRLGADALLRIELPAGEKPKRKNQLEESELLVFEDDGELPESLLMKHQ